MPWRGAEEPGEFPTLGWEIIDWIEEFCVIPDGDRRGQPVQLTESQQAWFLHLYRLTETGDWFHPRGGQRVRPQKAGKSPEAAMYVCVEAEGPALFDGWDADGEPVGRPWATPHIQLAATSEDQVGNTWSALGPMIDLGPLADIIPDTGLTRIKLRGGGLIEPVTSKALSKLGARITAAVFDETGTWTASNGGHALARTMRRGLAGMNGRAIETTNAWNPNEDSVAQRTFEHQVGVYCDFPQTPKGSIHNKRERRRCLRAAYGDAVHSRTNPTGWVDLDRIETEIDALVKEGSTDDAERFFLNRITVSNETAVNIKHWDRQGDPKWKVAPKRRIVIGVDGARFHDSLAIVATDVNHNFQWPIGIWERPPDADDDYEHPFDEIDATFAHAMDTWDVWRVYIDPQYISELVADWQGTYGEKRVIKWLTHRTRPAAFMVRSYVEAITSKTLIHDDDPVMRRHIAQTRRKVTKIRDDNGRPLYIVQKDGPNSPRSIDAFMAGALSWEARTDCIAAGEQTPKNRSGAFSTGGRR